MHMSKHFFISKKWLLSICLPFLLVVFPVIINSINGYLVLTNQSSFYSIGVFFRGLVILFAIYCILKQRQHPIVIYTLVIVLLWFVLNCIWMLFADVYIFQEELKEFTKVIFMLLLVIIYFFINKFYKISSDFLFTLISWWGVFAGLSIIITSYFAIGFTTYDSANYNAFGQKAFFDGQNDISISIGLSLVVMFHLFIKHQNFTTFFKMIIAVVGCLSLGTRAGFIMPVILMIVYPLSLLIKNKQNISQTTDQKLIRQPKTSKTKTLFIISILIVVNVGAVSYLLKNTENVDFMLGKLKALQQGSARGDLELIGRNRITNRHIILFIFGEGGYSFGREVGKYLRIGYSGRDAIEGIQVKMIENDLFDIMGNFGILFFLILYMGYGIIYLYAFKNMVTFFNLDNFTIFLVFTLFFAHSSSAGHCLLSPQTMHVVAPVFFICLNKYFKCTPLPRLKYLPY